LQQQTLASTYPLQVSYGSETYDLPMSDETGVSDGVHRSSTGFAAEAQRAGREVLSGFGLYAGNVVGPRIASASYDGTSIVVSVTHDEGTALANRAGTAYSGTPIAITPSGGTGLFTLVDATGANIPITSVTITGAAQITIVPSVKLIAAGNILRYGYNAMFGVDLNSAVFDNHADNPLPLRASYAVTISGTLATVEGMSNLVSFFSPEATYNAGGTASNAVVWTKRAGSGSSARKDDAKAAPAYYSNISTVLTGCPAIAGWVFDGTASQKLLVETALTGSSNFTLFVVATPYVGGTDSSTNNALIATSAIPASSAPLFLVRQTNTALQTLNLYCGSTGTALDVDHSNTTTVIVMQRSGSSCKTWNEQGADNTITISGTPVIDTDTNPVYAIGNIPFHGTGTSDSNSTYRGAVHYVVLFDTALSDAQVNQIRIALGAAVGVSIT
jgi:hypothetical protein